MAFYKDLKDQQLLLPLNIRELIPDNHICFLVDKIIQIQNLDLTEFEKKYEGAGHPAYHPKLLLKLLILGITDGIRSSRKIAKNARENVSYMYLAGLLKPDFRTISDFRKNNPDLIYLSFKEVVKYASAVLRNTVRSSLVSATTARSVSERKVALAICDTSSHSGSSSRI